MVNNPLVSIIIPVYNGSNFLCQAIDSALQQTYENIEIIVVNDGSKDNDATEKIALSYGDKIRYIAKENGGVSSALNTGIKHMNGEYFSWLSHDDMYKPDKVRLEIEALQKYGDDDSVVLCKSEHINANSVCIQKSSKKSLLSVGKNAWHDVLKVLFVKGSFNGCAFLIPKKVFDVCGGFDENLRYSQDAFMWQKMFLRKFNLIYIDSVCVCNRIHGGQLTQRGRDVFYRDSEYISEIIIPAILQEKDYAETFLYAYAKYNAKMNCKNVVDACLIAAGQERLFGLRQKIRLNILKMYGDIRPTIRKMYYLLFRRVKTK